MMACVLSSFTVACDAESILSPYSPPSTVDVSQLTWTKAFDALDEKIIGWNMDLSTGKNCRISFVRVLKGPKS